MMSQYTSQAFFFTALALKHPSYQSFGAIWVYILWVHLFSFSSGIHRAWFDL